MRRFAAFAEALARRRGALAALVFLVALVAVAMAAPLLAPQDPLLPDRQHLLVPPGSGHLLGTDELGRDLLSRLLYGTRLTFGLAIGAVLLALLPGSLLGLVAAFRPGWTDTAILRGADVLLSLPSVLAAVAVVAVLGPGLANTMLAIAISSLPAYVRLLRAVALGELAKPYVQAARAVGAGTPHLMFRTVLPNCLGPVVVNATLDFSAAMLTAAGLGFLGLGAQPPDPEWGAMLANARDFLGRANWMVAAPGLAILASSFSVNVLGDTLNDLLDPQRRH
jgi:dipeptide transport system permease protein